jgi:hypothetical protein
MTDGERHGQNCQSECERDPEQTDADIRKSCRKDGAATATEDEPERADEFGAELVCHFHSSFSPVIPVCGSQ